MTAPLLGVHHVTAMAKDPPSNVAFYTRTLGLRLVKRTVNFDDPTAHHLYYGNRTGAPGTIVTFFPYPHIAPGAPGAGESSRTDLAIPVGAADAWRERLQRAGVEVETLPDGALAFQDHDGLRLGLRESEGADDQAMPVRRVVIDVPDFEATARFVTGVLGFEAAGDDLFSIGDATLQVRETPRTGLARLGAGSMHHIAWRVADEPALRAIRERIASERVGVTDVRDRCYFKSIYFREPGGALFEIATDTPGFTVDEDEAALGTALKLPPWLEDQRQRIEAALPEINPT